MELNTRSEKTILIIFSVLDNLGDRGLVIGLIEAIKKRVPNSKFIVSCKRKTQDAFPYPTILDLDSAVFEHKSVFPRVWIKTLQLLKQEKQIIRSHRISNNAIQRWKRAVKQSDLVICAPGGYLNDYYGVNDRGYMLEYIMGQGKKVFIVGQSIGPFYKKDSIRKMQNVLPQLKSLILREKYSAHQLDEMGVKSYNLGQDLGFLLKVRELKQKKKKKAVVNFRYWKNDEETDKIIKKGALLCDFLMEKYSYSLEFISTCQGSNNYVNDALIGRRINAHMENNMMVENKKYELNELLLKLSSFDCYIGMRLHGGIFSMLCEVPSLIIGYEEKSKGIFESMGYEAYEFNYSEPLSVWKEKAKIFVEDKDTIRNSITQKTSLAMKEAEKSLSIIFESLKNEEI